MKKTLITLSLGVALMGSVSSSFAHGDEDHSQDNKKTSTAAPATMAPVAGGQSSTAQRLADGSLFVPKPVQRQMALRTVVATVGQHASTVELNGRVIADPATGGRVQATQSGRILPGPKGLAVLGQRVRQGESLGILQPVANSLERGSQQAQLAEIAAQLETAERRRSRLEQLDGVVPQKEIESARFEVDGLRARKAALGNGLNGGQPLLAPVSGVVAAASVVNGQIVEAREILFEIIDPQRLAVEALAYDAALADAVGGASAVSESKAGSRGNKVELTYVGGGKVLREQALPLLFRVKPTADEKPAALAVGQPLKVYVRTSLRQSGIAVPVTAVTRNAGGESIVWVHADAERFLPRKVRVAGLDGTTVAITDGVANGERVVVQGAASLTQVR